MDKKDVGERVKRVKAAFEKVLSTKQGVDVFKTIMEECGFKSSSVIREMHVSADGKTATPGEILPFCTVYNESRRDVWLSLRRYMSPESVNKIEKEEEPDADE